MLYACTVPRSLARNKPPANFANSPPMRRPPWHTHLHHEDQSDATTAGRTAWEGHRGHASVRSWQPCDARLFVGVSSPQSLGPTKTGVDVPPKKKSADTTLRVIKKIAPRNRGAKALTERFGDQLVCVRHRLDATGTKRLTTVELIVSESVISRRPGPTVDIDVHPREKDLVAKLKAAGARWHKDELVWSLRRSTAIALGLKTRIVPRKP